MQPFWFHLSFYSSLYKLINRRVWIKKVSFFIFCIAGALSAFHTAAIKLPGALGSLFSFRTPRQTPSMYITPDVAALLLGTSRCCQKKGLMSFALRTKLAPAALRTDVQHDFVSGTQPSWGGCGLGLHLSAPFSSLPHFHCLAWLGWQMGPASLHSNGVQTGCAGYFICFIFKDS